MAERQRAEADARLEELALKAAAGDQAALEQAFAMTLGIARRYCATRIDPSLQDDVIQEICLAALRALPRYQRATGSSFIGLVCGIAAHKVADSYRAMARQREQHELVPDIRDVLWDGPDPEQVVLAAESAVHVDFDELLAVLTDQQREVVVLLIEEDLSPKRVAERLGVKSGAVRIARHRAIAKMRAAVGVAA